MVFAPCRHLLLHVRVETRHVHAERHLAKAGVARCKGGVSPPGAKRGRAQRRSAQAKRGRLGKPLSPRGGQRPLGRLGFLIQCASAHIDYGEGVAGRNGPQRWKRRTRTRSKRGGAFLHQAHILGETSIVRDVCAKERSDRAMCSRDAAPC
jgi:hypothetical protein